MTCPGTRETLKKFDRDTRGLFVGLLGILALAAWTCLTLFQERQPPKADLTDITSQVKYDSSPTASSGAGQDLSTHLTSETALSEGPAQDPSKGNLAESQPAKAPVPSSIAALSSGTSLSPTPLASKGERSVASRPDFVRTIRGKASYQSYRLPGQLGDSEVKRRLLELWHRSLAHSEKDKSWAMFSKLGKRKKAATNAGTKGTL
jgi:hypothetical protein